MTEPIPPHGGKPVLVRGRVLGEGRAVVIMLHGRNAGPENILELTTALDHPDVTYLAPAAAGGTWYPMGFMSPTELNEPGISSGISVVHALIEAAVVSGVPAERIVLLGFSQGACLASTAAQRRPDRYGGVIVYSGGLIGPPGTVWSEQGTLGGTTAFFGCSDRDAHIPEERVRASAQVYERMGAVVTTRIYPGMGHLVNADEIAFTRGLLARLAGPPASGRA
jgi:phospholipase/carboxylesterase